MRVPDRSLAQVWDQGFTIVENFLDRDTLAAAQAAMWEIYPRPEDYFRAPEEHPELSRGQFAGLRLFPYGSWALSRLAVYPDLVDGAERLLETRELEIYKIELWAKYAGAINYDQPHHRDFGNHSLVVPRADRQHTQMTTFILLSDVTADDAPTKLVPLEFTRELPLSKRLTSFGKLFDHEVAATASAGSLLIYKTDVFHRGSNFTGARGSRFMLLADFQQRGWRWQGKMSWPDRADMPGMREALVNMTPRERDLFGWPPAGSDYWNEQTIAGVAARYPGMDMTPYLNPSIG
ncbi:MAG: phytanoyl-CoA dioxygenase family protein [Candidatus Binataceae bacterium]